MYHLLRLEIIKAQICVHEFYKWKNAIRNYSAGTSNSLFQKYMIVEKLNRKRWGMDLKKKAAPKKWEAAKVFAKNGRKC